MVSFKPSIQCPEHDGAWGSDPECNRCTDEAGEPLPYRARSTDPGVERPEVERQDAVTDPVVGVTKDGVVIEDPKSYEVRMRAMHLEAHFLRELGREGAARQVEARIPDDWKAFLDWEESQIATHQTKRNRRPVWMFFLGLGIGLLIGAIAIFGVHGKRESVAARVQACETMTGEQAMCLVEPKDEYPW